MNITTGLKIIRFQLVKCFIRQKSCQEITMPVPWGHIAGKWWGPIDKRPVLAIHGWQDNAGSYNRLIPLLNDLSFLAIDLPGHGRSSKLPQGLYYTNDQYVVLVEYIRQHLGWNKISFMGHSLGVVITYLYGAFYPNIVNFSICLDAAKPLIYKNNNDLIAKLIQNFMKYAEYELQSDDPPSYSLEEIMMKLCARKSVFYEHTHHLIERMIAPSTKTPGKYFFTRDARLKCEGLANFPQNELVTYAKNIKYPYFIGKAKGTDYYEDEKNFFEVVDVLKRVSTDCCLHYIEGTHHFHLNTSELVAGLINDFIARNRLAEGHSKSDMKDHIIVA
ncbi:probable serine hydrolase [Aethina tumida]|uniref:probable serine hydrolase n=1 Tax=Aethina tumida TaxID=116153 RepID=UPI002148C868|nr:probable serine hydrolase [Aethina tumida]